MDTLIIHGGARLKGDIFISGSKNAALPIMAASLLTDAVILNNIPKLTDIITMKILLEEIGSVVSIIDYNENYTIKINNTKINNLTAPYDIVRKMRASIWVLGPLLARFSQAKVSLPGGCAIGARLVDLHVDVLKAMGANITIDNGYINASVKGKLKGTHFTFKKISVGATINAIMAATLADGETVLNNCACEPEIVDLCNALQQKGAEILGIGTRSIRIIGKTNLKSIEYTIMSDRIEGGTYMIAAAITKGDLNIHGINLKLLKNLTYKLKKAGVQIISNNSNTINVSCSNKINAIDIETNAYPGIATDLQAQFMTLMTIANGSSIIIENIFENRFMHVPELCRMGANIKVIGNTAKVYGVPVLRGAEVMASDLRASVALVLAGLVAEGKTSVHRIYHLDRGYQTIEKKLNNCGAKILRLNNK